MKGMNIAVGSVFKTLKRQTVEMRFEALGATLSNTVEDNTDVLAMGGFGQTRRSKGQLKRDNANRLKAKALGIPIWNEFAIAARLRRADRRGDPSIGKHIVPRHYDQGRTLTLTSKTEIQTASDFDPLFLPQWIDHVMARFDVMPRTFSNILTDWESHGLGEGPAPFHTPDGVHENNICHPFTLEALCSGDIDGVYEVLEFHLDGQPFRRLVHIPAGNCVSFAFNMDGDCLYELSELMAHGDLETLAICALTQQGQPGDALADLVDKGLVDLDDEAWKDVFPSA